MIKDSGERVVMGGGMIREPDTSRINYSLVFDGPMFYRWAEHLTRGASKYQKRNWLKCTDGTEEERRVIAERFRESAVRHFVQWLRGDSDEDHAAALMFNVNGLEHLRTNDEKEPPF